MLSLLNAHHARVAIDGVYLGGVDSLKDLNAIERSIEDNIVNSVNKLNYGAFNWNEASDMIRKGSEKATSIWNTYKNSPSHLTDERLQTYHSLVDRMNQFMRGSDTSIAKLQDIIQKQDKSQLAAFASNELYKFTDPISNTLSELINLHVEDNQEDYQTALFDTKWNNTRTLIILVVSFTIFILLAIAIIKSIIKPLEYVVDRVNHVAEGDTGIDVKMISKGELGNLLQAVRNMILSTQKMSMNLATLAEGNLTVDIIPRSDKDVLGHALYDTFVQMRSMIGEIKEEVNALTSSSQEIMTSLAQLSSGSTETAAAVTETTTTIEELKQTAHISAEKAKDVMKGTDETIQTMKASERSIIATIDDMNQIRERMQIISDSILKLSEKSLAISEIMDSVNDLAEQSNLLAVNAAIEAAKAGEQGRSFSIVAQEIRNLAEQSKSATVQVRSLLNEIQNATNAAVLATEQGSKAVAKGVDQSIQTNDAIKELTENLSKVTQATGQIVLSNQQQLVGVEQVTIAMTNINEATNQHVEHLKQIETAVASLNEVGSALKDLTDQYKLTSEEKKGYIRKPLIGKKYHPKPKFYSTDVEKQEIENVR